LPKCRVDVEPHLPGPSRIVASSRGLRNCSG
jgi:hypothetical protein